MSRALLSAHLNKKSSTQDQEDKTKEELDSCLQEMNNITTTQNTSSLLFRNSFTPGKLLEERKLDTRETFQKYLMSQISFSTLSVLMYF
jgi:hypothetical protein